MSQPEAPLIAYPQGCVIGSFLRRVKRFSVGMRLYDEEVWVHSNNSGSMLGLLRPEMPMLASPATTPGRKLLWTHEATWVDAMPTGFWVGVNTSIPNKMIEAAFYAGKLPWAEGYTLFAREKRRGESRLDARLDGFCDGQKLPTLWVECKNVTMVEDGVASFPDAATERGCKHLREMMDIVASGERAAMFYLVQRPDGQCFAPADYIDPVYAALFYEALNAGVEMYAHRASVSEQGIMLQELLPIAPRAF